MLWNCGDKALRRVRGCIGVLLENRWDSIGLVLLTHSFTQFFPNEHLDFCGVPPCFFPGLHLFRFPHSGRSRRRWRGSGGQRQVCEQSMVWSSRVLRSKGYLDCGCTLATVPPLFISHPRPFLCHLFGRVAHLDHVSFLRVAFPG